MFFSGLSSQFNQQTVLSAQRAQTVFTSTIRSLSPSFTSAALLYQRDMVRSHSVIRSDYLPKKSLLGGTAGYMHGTAGYMVGGLQHFSVSPSPFWF